ncbi:MAG: hypothetical protein C0603_03325 [Denitrovibrio sp.]|nr:MAG: hypothetical protein C0603_03325 [Denitrovibrio sp.]
MNELITNILKIIKDYREDDLFVTINENHIARWVNQFDENDREFLLTELLHLLPECYLSKQHTLSILKSTLDVLAKDYNCTSVQELLDQTYLMDCQPAGKSQGVFLGFIREVIEKEYSYDFSKCTQKDGKRNWIYLDDVLATGGTFRNNITKAISDYGHDKFTTSDISIISMFVILHRWGMSNVKYAVQKKFEGFDAESRLKFYCVTEVENDPRVNYYNPNPSFNNVFPTDVDNFEEILVFIESKCKRNHEMTKKDNALRNASYPNEEKFYTSKENRNRYEKILLEKGYEIMKSIDYIEAASLRPLGMINPTYLTLGTGTHYFTWRNISNTCPLVFWWQQNGWHPLFPVQNRGVN